jgi:hypothetical protein
MLTLKTASFFPAVCWAISHDDIFVAYSVPILNFIGPFGVIFVFVIVAAAEFIA